MDFRKRRSLLLAGGVVLALTAGLLYTYRNTSNQGRDWQWTLAYSTDGSVERVSAPGGSEVRWRQERDSQRRLIRIVKQVNGRDTASFVFDRFGHRTQMGDAEGRTEYEYDGFGRLTALRRQGLPPAAYSYDTLNRLKTLRIGNDWVVAYSYDFLDRLAAMATPVGRIGFQYEAGQGMVIRTLPNGIRTVREFEPNGWLKSITHATPTGRVLARFTYQYRLDGLIRQVEEILPDGIRTIRYEYDSTRRVTAVHTQARSFHYRYDPYGNRIAAGSDCCEAAYDWRGQIVRVKGRETERDSRANLTTFTMPEGTHEFAFDEENRLISGAVRAKRIGYGYDGDGQLVRRRAEGVDTRYVTAGLSDRWMPLAEIQGGLLTAAFLWDGDTPIATVRGTDVEFYLEDHLGSVRLSVDGSGRPTSVLGYEPFGAPETADIGTGLRPGFSGIFYDADQQLYITRFRAYAPALGRFLQMEPQQSYPPATPGSTSWYAYCGNDPVNFRDRSGLQRIRAAAGPTPILQELGRWEEQRNQLVRMQRLREMEDKGKDAEQTGRDRLPGNILDESVRLLLEHRIRNPYMAALGFQVFTAAKDKSVNPFDLLDIAREMFGRTAHDIGRVYRESQNEALKHAIEARYRYYYPLFKDQAPRAHKLLVPNSVAGHVHAGGNVLLSTDLASEWSGAATSTVDAIVGGVDAALKLVDQVGQSDDARQPHRPSTPSAPGRGHSGGTRQPAGSRWPS